jgi:hypothetical protein
MCIADCHGEELMRVLSSLPRRADDAMARPRASSPSSAIAVQAEAPPLPPLLLPPEKGEGRYCRPSPEANITSSLPRQYFTSP